MAFVFATGIGFAVLIGASSVVALRTGVLPGLVAGYGAVLAIYSAVVGVVATFKETGAFSAADGVLGLIAFLGFLLWVLATSAVLVSLAAGGSSASATL